MDVRQLKYFVQIVESGSFSKASRQLFVVQPALSQQISKLEDQVGKPLLVRSARGVVPTRNGDALYRYAKFLLRQIDDAVLIARDDSESVQGRVALGLAPSTASVLGLPMVRHLKQRYPGILLTVVVGLPGVLEERARHGQLDLAILFSETAASELTFEPLLEEQIAVVVPSDSALVSPERTSLTVAEVAALPLVLSSHFNALRRRIELEFERMHQKPHVVAEIDSLELVMRYVAEGGGATVQPIAATEAWPLQNGWRCVPISDAPITRTNYLYAQPLKMLPVATAVVRAELKVVVEQLVDQGRWRGVRLRNDPPTAPESGDPSTA